MRQTIHVKILLLLFGAVCASFAQLNTASILGTVTDSSGAVVPSAAVTVQNQDTGATYNITADARGNFVAPLLPVGTYRVTATATGFKTQVQENIGVSVSDRINLSITLEPGAISERVTVTGEAPIVDTASTTLGGVVESRQVKDLPLNGRNVSQLLAVVPGVSILGPSTQQSANGASIYRQSGAVKFLLDGGDASRVDFDYLDNTYGASKNRISRASVDAIQEFRVYTSSFSSEFGGALAGAVNLITKSGTNQFHGSVFEYFRNEKLDSRNYFNVAPQLKPPFRLNQFGGSLGGPIVHDKLFFFLNYEGIRQRLGAIQNTFVPTAAFRAQVPQILRPAIDQLPLPNGEASPTEPRLGRFVRSVSNPLNEDTGSMKADWRPSSKDSLTVRYNLNASLTKNFFGVAKDQNQRAEGLLQLGKLSYTRVLSPKLLNEAGFVFNRMRIDPRAAESEEVRNFPITALGSGSAGVGPALFDLLVSMNSFTYLDNLTYVKGRHQLKFGAEIIRIRHNKALFVQRTITYLTLDDFLRNSPFSVGTLGYPRVGLRNTYNNFFVQDDIRVSGRLTINAGLRYQYDTAPHEVNGIQANFNRATGTLNPKGSPITDPPDFNFAPRFGFAYALTESKRTVLRGGFGMFYVNLNDALAQNVPSNIIQGSINVTRQQVPDLAGFPFPPLRALTPPGLSALPEKFHAAYSQQWNLNVQQAIGQDSLLQVGYIGNRGLHLTGPGYNVNRLLPGTAIRPYPLFGDINLANDDINSVYNSLQVTFRRRLSKGLNFNANYTWAHSLDFAPVLFGAFQDDQHVRNDYSSSDFDVRHILEFDYNYQLPTPRMLPKRLAGGWQVNGMTILRTGTPFSVTCGCDSNRVGTATSRANFVSGAPLRPLTVDIPNAQVNFAAFTAPPAGAYGASGRNIIRGPAAINFDFSVFKNFRITESQSVEFRAELFNIFNTPQFGNPSANLLQPATFGRSLSTIGTTGGFGTNRQVQFALRHTF